MGSFTSRTEDNNRGNIFGLLQRYYSLGQSNRRLFGAMDLEDVDDIDDFDSDSGSETNEAFRRRNGVESVFQLLLESGQINVMSSDDESDDGSEYNISESERIRYPPPVQVYDPNLENIKKNDISLIMREEPLPILARKNNGVVNLVMNRELGMNRSFRGGYNSKQKSDLVSHFLPNSVRKVSNYGYKAFCGTYSKDGSIFLTASQDRSIRIYNTANGSFNEIKKFCAKDVGWSVLDTAFSPDGQYVAYSSWSESIHICRIDDETDRHDSLSLIPDSRRFCIFSIAFSENGNEILGGANDGLLYIFDRDLNQRVLKINAHNEDVNSVAFADETSHILFSVADDAIVKVWDRRCLSEAEPRPVGILAGHIDGITFVNSKNDGRYLITNSKDQSIKLWDLRAFSTDEAVSACHKAMARNRWDYRWQRVPKSLCVARDSVPGDTSIMTYRGHSVLNTLIRCRFSPSSSTNQRFIYTGCGAGRVVIYDLLTGKLVKALDGHEACVRDVSWHPENCEIVSTSWDGSIGLWTCESQHALTAEDEAILGINSNPEDISIYNVRRSSRLAAKTLLNCPSPQ